MKQPPRIIGVTGGIATGKTTVLNELKRLGIPVIASDPLAHQSLRPGQPIYRKVVAHFGPGILRSNGSICRTDLGKIVFANPRERKWLERQIHPFVIRKLKTFALQNKGIVALDIPLLFEAKLEKLVDVILVVGSSTRTQLTRLQRRDGLSKKEARGRLRAQLPLSYKRKRAHAYLLNEGSRASLCSRLRRFLKQFQKSLDKR